MNKFDSQFKTLKFITAVSYLLFAYFTCFINFGFVFFTIAMCALYIATELIAVVFNANDRLLSEWEYGVTTYTITRVESKSYRLLLDSLLR